MPYIVEEPDFASSRYTVRNAIRRTGLSADMLRAWERRYGAVRPGRSAGGQRFYTEADLERLTLLHEATTDGYRIGDIARLDAAGLRRLLGKREHSGVEAFAATHDADSAPAAVDRAMDAVAHLNAPVLERTLRHIAVTQSSGILYGVVTSLMSDVGEGWHSGKLGPAHEHLASATLRRLLSWKMSAHEIDAAAPGIVITTPRGELHELGAMVVAAVAAEEGWRAIFLGPDLPARDIASAAVTISARAVALSITNSAHGSRAVGD
ncbi:MAG: MerR family transcriptional regulator, partial [Gemmatimonadaceae bacterium]